MASLRRIFLGVAILALTSPAYSQSSTDDLAAQKADSDARTAEAGARKAEAEADKAEAETEAAVAKAQFGSLADYKTTGTTALSSNAGQIEASILAAQAARLLAQLVVGDVCAKATELCTGANSQPKTGGPGAKAEVPATPPEQPQIPLTICGDLSAAGLPVNQKLYLFAESEKPVFDSAEIVQAALCGVRRTLDAAITSSDRLNSGGELPALGPATVFTALDIAGNLLRSDYSFEGISISPDDMLLAKLFIAEASGRVAVPIFVPGLYRPAALSAGNPLMVAIGELNDVRAMANSRAREHRARAETLAKKKATAGAAKKHAEVAGKLETAVKGYDDYLAKIAAPSDKGISELAEAARQVQIRNDLASGSYLLALKMNSAGGLGYTKKNFWTFLGGAPFFVSGGAVTSYALIEGKTGAVRAAGSFGSASDFRRIGELHRN